MLMKCVRFVLALTLATPLLPLQAQLTQRNRPYRLQPSDQVTLSYRYTPEYDENITVQPDGAASIKLIGSVNIGGLTIDEAQAKVTEALKSRLNDPEITLTLSEWVKPSYVVAGYVSAPGKFEIHGNVTVIQAIAIAGGFKDNAKHSQVILFRRVSDDTAKTTVLNVKSMINPNHPKLNEDIALQPGDMLIVPKNTVSKIADYVHWVGVGSYFPLF
jgi:polysaccharide export outer membrane protein